MRKMGRYITPFLLASAILLCSRRSHAFNPHSFEEILAKSADEYGDEMVKRNMETRNSGTLYFLIVYFKYYLISVYLKVLKFMKYNDWLSSVAGSLSGCALATLDKCYGFSGGVRPGNLIEVWSFSSFNNLKIYQFYILLKKAWHLPLVKT